MINYNIFLQFCQEIIKKYNMVFLKKKEHKKCSFIKEIKPFQKGGVLHSKYILTFKNIICQIIDLKIKKKASQLSFL